MSKRSFAETERLHQARERTRRVGGRRRNQWEGVWLKYRSALKGDFRKTRRFLDILHAAQIECVEYQFEKRNTAPSKAARNAGAVKSGSSKLSKTIFGSSNIGPETSEVLSRVLMKTPEVYDSILGQAQKEYLSRFPREDPLEVMWKAQDALNAALAGSARLARWSEAATQEHKAAVTSLSAAGAKKALPATVLIRYLASRRTELAALLGEDPAKGVISRGDELDGWLVDLATVVEVEAIQNQIIRQNSVLTNDGLKRLLLSTR